MTTVAIIFAILFGMTAGIAWRLALSRADYAAVKQLGWDRAEQFKRMLQDESRGRLRDSITFAEINTQNAETIAKRTRQYEAARDLALALSAEHEHADQARQTAADYAFQFGAMIAGIHPELMEDVPPSGFDLDNTVGDPFWRGFDYGMTPHPEFRGDPEEIAGPDPQFGRLKVGTRVGRSDGVVWERATGGPKNLPWSRVDLGFGEIRESHAGMRNHGYKVLEPETAPEETEEA